MRGRLTAVVVILAIAGGTATLAQRGWRGGWYRMPPKFPVESPSHRSFTFSRILYDSDRREAGGQGWYTDYPTADQNLMIRLSEMTTTDVGFDRYDEPDHVVVRLTDDALFDYPFIFMSDVGTLRLSDVEAVRLREYLEKGGFLWVDDFWGPWAWEQWLGEISRVLPPAAYPIFDIPAPWIRPASSYEVRKIPYFPSSTGPERRVHTPSGAPAQRRGALPRHRRRPRPPAGADEPQHRHRRRLGARGRGLRVLLPLLGPGVRRRHQHRRSRHDELTGRTPCPPRRISKRWKSNRTGSPAHP